jgi:hypothetical protein
VTAGLCVLALALVLAFLGTRLSALTAPEDTALQRLVLGTIAGMVLFHLLVTLLDLTGLRWSAMSLSITLGLALGIALAAAIALDRRYGDKITEGERRRLPSDLGWGDETALLSLAVFALIALTLWATTPDFVFHWGIKGHRFFLAGGVDYAYLARSWAVSSIHPDYPNLVPELYAASALAAGRFDPPSLMLWSAVFFALLLAAVREALRGLPRGPRDPWGRQAGVALAAVSLGAFAIGHRMAGGADWLPALALVAAIPALSRPPDPAGDSQIGVLAAFAAAAKVEGVMLAGLLCLVQLVRRPADGAASGPWLRIGRLLRLGALPALVILPWWIQVQRYHLFSVMSQAHLTAERTRTVLMAVLDVLNFSAWHGFSYTIVLLPLLFLRRSTRPLGLVLGAQLAFYLWIYLSSGFETRLYVLTSFPRLLFHLVPAVMVGAMLALSPTSAPRSALPASPTPPSALRSCRSGSSARLRAS